MKLSHPIHIEQAKTIQNNPVQDTFWYIDLQILTLYINKNIIALCFIVSLSLSYCPCLRSTQSLQCEDFLTGGEWSPQKSSLCKINHSRNPPSTPHLHMKPNTLLQRNTMYSSTQRGENNNDVLFFLLVSVKQYFMLRT